MQNKQKLKIGIYSAAILMMGVIGVAGSLSTIGANFPDLNQTMITSLISIPCLIIIPVTLITGKLMESVAKKVLLIIGILAFLFGGIIPGLMTDFTMILIMRGILGIGIGIIQVTCSALVAENFEGAEREKVQGNMTSAQMLGCGAMVFIGGWLGSIAWNIGFYVHFIGIISLMGVIALVPFKKPEKSVVSKNSEKVKITTQAWGWIGLMFIFFIGGQIYSNSLSFLINDYQLGTAATAGLGLAFFAFGGFVMGMLFGKLANTAKSLTFAIGLLLLSGSYLLVAFAGSMTMIYAGSLICGIAFSICMPALFIGAASSVEPLAVGMVVAIATCSLNLAMFLSPYVVNPIAAMLGQGVNNNQMAFIFGAALIGAMGIIALIWGFLKSRREIPEIEMK
ncbi:MFS transporter [Acetobacterium sp. KB-1]|nr:MFS transporter [Acetobacterium sp. KB-1]